MASLDTGRVRIRLSCTGGRVNDVQLGCERPDVTPVLRGRSASQAVQLIPLLFGLCCQSQSRAATLALAAARGEECQPRLDPEVQREVLREHLWRWLLDLPALLGKEALQQEFVSGAKSIAAGNRDALRKLLAEPQIENLRLLLPCLSGCHRHPLAVVC